MEPTIDVISIGTLSSNALWNESSARRAAHATTTLIRDGAHVVLVDPSLPGELLAHRLDERAGLTPKEVDVVFLTSFLPVHRRGLDLFAHAEWYMGGEERAFATERLNAVHGGASGLAEGVSLEEVETELELLGRISDAPSRLSAGVDVFPTPGPTPGHCSLLVMAHRTIVVAGDAVLTKAHVVAGRIWARSFDRDRARESFAELCEIADVVVPGHDNVFFLG